MNERDKVFLNKVNPPWGVLKKVPLQDPKSPPNYPVACPHATTSIIMSLTMDLIRGERKNCRSFQVVHPNSYIPYRKPSISSTASPLP